MAEPRLVWSRQDRADDVVRAESPHQPLQRLVVYLGRRHRAAGECRQHLGIRIGDAGRPRRGELARPRQHGVR
jgi:hypothetical protein